MKQLDDFYSECLDFPISKVKAGNVKVVASERRLLCEEGYGIVFPFFMLSSNNRYIISVHPDMFDLVYALVQTASDAKILFNEDAGAIIGAWCKTIVPEKSIKNLRRSNSFELYVDRESFRPYSIPECKQINENDKNINEEMNKISDFWCPNECIKDGTAFGVIIDGKIVSRSTTIITPDTTEKYKLVWLGVETLMEYRRKGYAKAVVSGTTETLLSRGLTPVYSHAVWNVASGKTARSLGYMLYGEILRWQY